MTESEWLGSTEPQKMMSYVVRVGDDRLDVIDGDGDSEPEVIVVPGWATERKCRLLASACCRLNVHLMAEPAYLLFLSVFDRFVEGTATPNEASDAGGAAIEALGLGENLVAPTFLALIAATSISRGDSAKMRGLECSVAPFSSTDEADWDAAVAAEKRSKSLILRDLFGNPFRTIALDPLWTTPTVRSLAQAAYDERALPSGELDSVRLAVLADALEDAGCADDALLSHLRSADPHVRGCWAVDLLLGKQ